MAKRGTYTITPADIAGMTDEEVTKAYRHYRYVANKRLVRLKRAGYTQYEAYKQYKGKFKESSSELSPRQMRNRLAKAGAFLRMHGSTVRDVQRYENRMVKQLHDKGYTFINKKNLADFGRFMDKVRDVWGSKAFDSDRVVQMFDYVERMTRRHVNMETLVVDNLDQFMKAEDELMLKTESLIEEAAQRGASQRSINRIINARDKQIVSRMMQVASELEGGAEWEEKEEKQRKPRSRQRRKR